ncbi:MAG: ABC transporter permease [Micrococcales bacterium]|nr:ABC transporter permease [Micrococcales bacterium]
MSTTTLEPAAARSNVSASARLTLPRVLVSEWRKLTTLRSTWWTLLIAVLVHVGMGALIGLTMRMDELESMGISIDATTLAVAGAQFSQLAIVVLAVMAITAEYSTGQIRSTVTAVPFRLRLLTAKAIVVSTITLLVAVVATGLSLGVGLLIAGDAAEFGLSTAENARILAATPLYLVAIALFGLGLGALLRSTAGAIALLMALLVVVENAFAVIPWRPIELISPWLPQTAGSRIFFGDEEIEQVRAMTEAIVLSPWQGYLVLLAWAALALTLAGIRLRGRDV